MKVTINIVSCLFLALLFSCSGGPEGQKVEAKEAKTPEATAEASMSASGDDMAFNLNKGTLNWTGSKVVGGSSHTGTIDVALGDLKVKGGKITGGQFVIDMNSINNTDLEAGQGKEKLEGHLKNEDFFDVAVHPKATFIVTGSEVVTGQQDVTHNITGNLTMKDSTKSITFPANVAIVDNKLTAVTPSFVIDRTQWGIEYGSSSIVGLAKDKVISNDIALVLSLEATNNAPVQ
ncbi:MAG: YceI family protein [Bacteroidota bacterium]